MNKELELEAEAYKNKRGSIPTTGLEDAIFKQGFIDGATSKYVEKQKLEFAIEQLKKIKIAVSDKNPFTVYNIGHQIQELEQQIKELENK